MQTQQTFASGTAITLSARFPAMAARIDNLSNQWYVITGMPGGWCPPYTAGLIIALAGAGSVSMTPQAPPSGTQAAPVAGEQVTVTLLSEAQPGGPGIGLPGSGTPTGLITLFVSVTALQNLTFIAGTKRLTSVLIKSDHLNTVDVILTTGGQAVFFFHLAPGESVSLNYIDPSRVYLGSLDSSAQNVSLLAVF